MYSFSRVKNRWIIGDKWISSCFL